MFLSLISSRFIGYISLLYWAHLYISPVFMKLGCHFGHTMCHATRPDILIKISLQHANNTLIIISLDGHNIVRSINKEWANSLVNFSQNMVFLIRLTGIVHRLQFNQRKRPNLSKRETRKNEKDRFRFSSSGALLQI